jgi:archaellum component FlaC
MGVIKEGEYSTGIGMAICEAIQGKTIANVVEVDGFGYALKFVFKDDTTLTIDSEWIFEWKLEDNGRRVMASEREWDREVNRTRERAEKAEAEVRRLQDMIVKFDRLLNPTDEDVNGSGDEYAKLSAEYDSVKEQIEAERKGE